MPGHCIEGVGFQGRYVRAHTTSRRGNYCCQAQGVARKIAVFSTDKSPCTAPTGNRGASHASPGESSIFPGAYVSELHRPLGETSPASGLAIAYLREM